MLSIVLSKSRVGWCGSWEWKEMVKKRVHTIALVIARFLASAQLSIIGVSRHRLTVCGVIPIERPLKSQQGNTKSCHDGTAMATGRPCMHMHFQRQIPKCIEFADSTSHMRCTMKPSNSPSDDLNSARSIRVQNHNVCTLLRIQAVILQTESFSCNIQGDDRSPSVITVLYSQPIFA